jgi:hypothetical protein
MNAQLNILSEALAKPLTHIRISGSWVRPTN